MEAVAELARQPAQVRTDSGDRDWDVGVVDRPRVEEGRHQAELVELTLVRQRRLVLPRLPDGPQGEDVVTEPRSGAEPLRGEATSDVGTNLGAQPEYEAPAGSLGEVP